MKIKHKQSDDYEQDDDMYDEDDEHDSEMDDFIDDDYEESDDGRSGKIDNYSKEIRRMFNYDPKKYKDVDDDDIDNMETDFQTQLREEKRRYFFIILTLFWLDFFSV